MNKNDIPEATATLIPCQRPMMPREVTANMLLQQHVTDAVAILAVRGFFDESGANQRGMYDDAIFLTSPSAHYAVNANTDPSLFRDGVAVLQPGVWRFALSVHGKSRPPDLQYPCLEQAEPVLVRRDGGDLDKGMFAIQMHRGRRENTDSLGCLTVPEDQYFAFMAVVREQLLRYGQKTLPILLTDH